MLATIDSAALFHYDLHPTLSNAQQDPSYRPAIAAGYQGGKSMSGMSSAFRASSPPQQPASNMLNGDARHSDADDEGSSPDGEEHHGTLNTVFDRLLATVVAPAPASPIAAHGLHADLYTPPDGLTLRGTRSDPHMRTNTKASSPLKGKGKGKGKGKALPFRSSRIQSSHPPLGATTGPHIRSPRSQGKGGFLGKRFLPDPSHRPFPGFASDTSQAPGKFRRYMATQVDDGANDPEVEGEMLSTTGVGGTVFRPVASESGTPKAGMGHAHLTPQQYGSFGPDKGFLAGPRQRTTSDYSIAYQAKRHGWWYNLIRPPPLTVERWLDSWLKRWSILIVVPSCIVWVWCAVPFPKTSPYDPNGPWCTGPSPPPWCWTPHPDPPMVATDSPDAATGVKGLLSPISSSLTLVQFIQLWIRSFTTQLSQPIGFSITAGTSLRAEQPIPPVDANFWFFLTFYYGIYCAVGLLWVTQLFTLYRLNWWPKALGAKISYTFFWLLSLAAGYGLHEVDLYRQKRRVPGNPDNHDDWDWEGDDVQWQRKTIWVGLAFATMAMPALVCLIGLRRSGRQRYSTIMTDLQRTFLERQFSRRIPASYTRFLWFVLAIGLALGVLVLGQAYASVFLSTLPHSGIEGTAYVALWQLTVTLLTVVSNWVLKQRVRSRALVFVFRYYYFLVYFIFYRNLFARLQSFNQFALLQLLSSFWVCIWYPVSMSSFAHRIVSFFDPQPDSWEEYVENIGLSFYLRNLAQNATMVAFLGWVSILHFGPNQALYPFFAFGDQYDYSKTMLGSTTIWASELASAFLARIICKTVFAVDVTNLGLGDMRAYPELVPTCLWTSVHVLMDMLLFLLKLNFR